MGAGQLAREPRPLWTLSGPQLQLRNGRGCPTCLKERLVEAAAAAPPGTEALEVEVPEVDALNDETRDLLDGDARLRYLQDVSDGHCDAAVVTPPCGTFSRALFANRQGPPPLRNARWPLGFTSFEVSDRRKTQDASALGLFSAQALWPR